ncbi:O-methyltransferase-domain-containing protein [Exophiala viscosa]|uniref:O-methyltransferase-domain-containing protein n=1 Tax=Exophiala viscosa TaxID=2486360 RepID=A0AAN6E004_9EURO|nr:O-methyltransferase-domain-containing protein [Exophiala viscosa]
MSTKNIVHAEAVAQYTESRLVPDTPAFAHAYTNSTAHGIPEIALSPAQGKFTSILASISGAKNVLELGTLGGYSALWFAQAIKGRGGKVTSIEINKQRRDVAIENLEYAGVKVPEEVEILLGAGLDVLPRLAEEIDQGKRERFDFTFIDADWDNQAAYFDWGVKLSNGKGSVIYVDNVVRQLLEIGTVGSAEKDSTVQDLVEIVAKDDRVEATVMQTCGSKDMDGFLLARTK